MNSKHDVTVIVPLDHQDAQRISTCQHPAHGDTWEWSYTTQGCPIFFFPDRQELGTQLCMSVICNFCWRGRANALTSCLLETTSGSDNATALHCMQLLSVVLSAFMDSVLVQAATDRSGVAIGLQLGWQMLIWS